MKSSRYLIVLLCFMTLAIAVKGKSLRAPDLPGQTSPAHAALHNIYPELKNGIYLIHGQLSDATHYGRVPDGFKLVVFNYDHLQTRLPEERSHREYLIIRTRPDVELNLAVAPQINDTSDKYAFNLNIELDDAAAQKLQKFTAKNLNRGVAMVIGGKVVTMHKIRSEIIGGRLQITRCNDNGCKYIYNSLQQ